MHFSLLSAQTQANTPLEYLPVFLLMLIAVGLAGGQLVVSWVVEDEWWVKVSRAVGGAEKSYDFPPHVVRVKSTYQTLYQETVEGDLLLRDSPWDPLRKRLPVEGSISARLWTPMPLGREITLEGALDPDAYWPYSDTIGGSRWPGQMGGPPRS